MTTVIVIGGGVIGSACALNLQARGIETRLIDPDPDWRGASIGNAGHIGSNEVEPLASWATLRALPGSLFMRGGPAAMPLRDVGAWLPFGLRLIAVSRPRRFAAGKTALSALAGEALPAWRRLTDSIARSDLLRKKGHFVVWESQESAARGRAALSVADHGTTVWRDADAGELALIGSLARPPAGAVRFDGTAQITDLPGLATALREHFEALGGIRIRGKAVLEGIGVRLETGERIDADKILVAAGAASGDVLRPAGHRVPLIAERGYHIQSVAPEWPDDMPSILFADRSMFVTGFCSGLRATSFVEFSRPSSPPDPRKWARLRSHVAALGLPFAEPAAEWIGCRPTLPDYLPAIGRSRRAPNLHYAFGHNHLGLTMAAITGELIGALIAGEKSTLDLAPFDLGRFE